MIGLFTLRTPQVSAILERYKKFIQFDTALEFKSQCNENKLFYSEYLYVTMALLGTATRL